MGYSYFAPYDRITVTCAAPYIPGPLLEQLKPGGIMVIPIGSDCYSQELYKIKRTAKAIYIKEKAELLRTFNWQTRLPEKSGMLKDLVRRKIEPKQ